MILGILLLWTRLLRARAVNTISRQTRRRNRLVEHNNYLTRRFAYDIIFYISIVAVAILSRYCAPSLYIMIEASQTCYAEKHRVYETFRVRFTVDIIILIILSEYEMTVAIALYFNASK